MNVRTVKTRDGYIFYEDQHYLRKIGTREFFPYCPELAKREDMIHYNPFARDTTKDVKKPPGVDDIEHHNTLMKKQYGMSRDEIREAVKDLNRQQRILWAINLLFQALPVHDLGSFNPTKGEIIRIIGPILVDQDVKDAMGLFKTNPMNIKYLIAEAATPTIEEQDDLSSTADISS